MKWIIVAALVGIPVVGASYWAAECPCDRTPGLFVRGTESTAPVTDWSFANQVPVCQIQVDAGLLPHALNLNCWASPEGQLFLSCADCDGKRWSTAVLANPQAKMKLGENVYPVTVTRVTDEAELDKGWNDRAAKTGLGKGSPRAAGWWSFRVVSR
ncbi:MAG: hypothetical protein AB7I50_17930 [Vicinamibacterales bacterium]